MLESNISPAYNEISPAPSPVTVSVIVPAKSFQSNIDMCCAALLCQDYPDDLLEIIVVDHGSDTPLVIPSGADPEKVRVARLDGGHGPGAARAEGARIARGEVLVFIDSDIIATSSMIREYVEPVLANPNLVSLGFRNFISEAEVRVPDVQAAIKENRLGEYLADKPAGEGQEWIDKFLGRCDDLRIWRDDLWIVVVGAGLALSRHLYDYSGGFRDFPEHGVEDTEFGFRLAQAGAQFAVNRSAVGYHLGLRTISRDRERINERRRGILANEIPHTRYRPPIQGRSWEVPSLVCEIQLGETATVSSVSTTIDDLLAQSFSDLRIVLRGELAESAELLFYYYSGETRLEFSSGAQDNEPALVPVSSPYTLRLPDGVGLARESVAQMVARLEDKAKPLARLGLVTGVLDSSVDLWRTSALSRQLRGIAQYACDRTVLTEEWSVGADYGVSSKRCASATDLKAGRYVRRDVS